MRQPLFYVCSLIIIRHHITSDMYPSSPAVLEINEITITITSKVLNQLINAYTEQKYTISVSQTKMGRSHNY